MTNFEVIPAIDIIGGKCVRLTRGRYETEEIYSDDPVEIAKIWEEQGAKRLHVVDLEGAKSGKVENLSIIKEIARKVNIPIEVGGGIRNLGTIEDLVVSGIERIILGTAVIENPDMVRTICGKYGKAIAIGIDARGGMAAIEGWTKSARRNATDLAQEAINLGAKRIIYTDIGRDGTLMGPNIDGIKEFAKSIKVPVIASGGISSKEDVAKIKKITVYGVEGCIIGKALYTGRVKLEEVL